MFEYLTKPRIKIAGCVSIKITQKYDYLYGIGSTPYILAKAKRGVLEKVVIKSVNILGSWGNQGVFNYVDTFNEVWMGNELCWQDEAVSIALNYCNIALDRYRDNC